MSGMCVLWLAGWLAAWACAHDEPPRAIAPFDAIAAQTHQMIWARYRATTVEEKNCLGLTLVLIPPGEFQMGSSPEQTTFALEWLERIPRIAPGEADRLRHEETPLHRVVLTQPFRIGRTEVTVGQYRQFIDATQYVTETERFGGGNSGKIDESSPVKRNQLWHSPGYPLSDSSPVTQITWNDMIEFCNWLSHQEHREPCYSRREQEGWAPVLGANGYRLPTEAEWEFACRAGTQTHFSFGDDVASLDQHAWFNRTAEVNGMIGARAVGTKRPNAFSLFDMHGNVWERCQDYFDPQAYRTSPTGDPQGPSSGRNRIVRGGGWHYFDLHCRSAYRNNYSPIARTGNTGFRVVRGL